MSSSVKLTKNFQLGENPQGAPGWLLCRSFVILMCHPWSGSSRLRAPCSSWL